MLWKAERKSVPLLPNASILSLNCFNSLVFSYLTPEGEGDGCWEEEGEGPEEEATERGGAHTAPTKLLHLFNYFNLCFISFPLKKMKCNTNHRHHWKVLHRHEGYDYQEERDQRLSREWEEQWEKEDALFQTSRGRDRTWKDHLLITTCLTATIRI